MCPPMGSRGPRPSPHDHTFGGPEVVEAEAVNTTPRTLIPNVNG